MTDIEPVLISILDFFANGEYEQNDIMSISELSPDMSENSTVRKVISRLLSNNMAVGNDAREWINQNVINKYGGKYKKILNQRGLEAAVACAKDAYARRSLKRNLVDAVGKIDEIDEPIEDIVSSLTKHVAGSASVDVYHGDSLPDPNQRYTLISKYPWSEFNKCMGGMHRNELIFIGARPSMGKSSMISNIALNCIKNDIGIVLITTEVTAKDYILNMACTEAKINTQKIQADEITDEERDTISGIANEFRKKPLWIIDKPGISIGEISSISSRLVSKHKEIEIVMVDYIQQIRTSHSEIKVGITDIADTLQYMKKTLDRCIMCASQLNRYADEIWQNPTMRLFKESGSIEERADVLLYLVRPSVYEPANYDSGTAYVHVLKNRNGLSGSKVEMVFDGTVRQFTEIRKMDGFLESILSGGLKNAKEWE